MILASPRLRCLTVVALLGAPGVAHADTAPARRVMPSYDGRAPRPSTTSEDLLWIPRVLLAPFYFFSEYLVRRPLGAVMTALERQPFFQRVARLLDGDRGWGLAPTLAYDHGFLPHAGLYVWWDDAFVPRNHVRLHASTWGPDFLDAAVLDRYDVGPRESVSLHAAFTRRSDFLFYGFGPDTRTRTESRYLATIFDVGPTYDLAIDGPLRFAAAAGVRDTTFDDSSCCGGPPLHDRVRRGELSTPPRLSDGYTIVYDRAELAFDTRAPANANRSGVRVTADGGPSWDLSRRPGTAWLGYGGSAGGFWDVGGTAHVVGLTAATRFVDPITGGGGAIPFNEHANLGGAQPLRGFLAGRLTGRSAAALTLDYRWPVWSSLEGRVQIATGNTFDAGLRGIEPGKLRLSAVFGLELLRSPDNRFEILTGLGTETFESGARISSLRVAFGVTRGF